MRHSHRSTVPTGKSAAAAHDLSHLLGASRVAQIRAALAAGEVEMTGPHVGRMTTDTLTADVLLEPDDLIRVRCAVELDEPPQALLERGAGAAGNVRFAAFPSGRQLAAETRVNGAAHLPNSLRAIRCGFTHLLAGTASPDEPQADSKPMSEALSAAIQQTGWSKEDAVETAQGYELHSTLEGVRTAVEAAVGPDSVLVRKIVLAGPPDGAGGCAVAHQALAMNARIRGCRLAIRAGRLQVETRLHSPLLDGDWLTFVVRAVAGAARCVEPELRLLADEPAVAEAYVQMFCASANPL
ncbi:MAG: hypothetical protein AB7U20_14405 [Planctomycetaceae bacterium]